MFNKGKGKFPKYLPFAFTEQGVAMLSAVLNSRLDALEQQYGQKFSDIEQVLNFLIQKDQKKTQHQQRDRIGFKK